MTDTPYGIRDIKVTPYTDAAGTQLSATSVDFPYARTLSFNEVEEFSSLRGDDREVAQHGSGATVEFDIEAGGLDFAAYKAIAGGTIVEEGVPGTDFRRVYSKKSIDQRPYFKVEGQAISDSGGDLHTIIYKCKCTGDLSGEFTDGEFFLTSASGVGIGDANDNLYDFVSNETVTPIAGGTVATITSITPDAQGAGDTVTIVGYGFTGATGVTFEGVAGTGLNVVSSTVLTVVLPAGAAGAATVIVTNAAGASVGYEYTRTV